ncbi:hypothetical protein CMI38_04180 [Candidatus Pacearchaeota archaeon]|nr:hypothetical protein [Candidatus Pacearchaeota archaeon]|tara:strand:- start:1675 stop:2235 length:561 start_codon:yes stop_codon:yes gene_type:complete
MKNNGNVLLINICKEKLHYYEFVKPVKDVLVKNNIKRFVRYYGDVSRGDLERASKVIICGTSLKDFEYLGEVGKFKWLCDFKKPVLGICGGMQIIGLVFGGKLRKKKEIGFYREKFGKVFLGLEGEKEVYHLHNSYVDFSKVEGFGVFSGKGNVSQAVKHRDKGIYGVLFHPEVRQKDLIKKFCLL